MAANNANRAAMMAVKLPSNFETSTRQKLTETSSGDFFKRNDAKLIPSFDRGVVEDGKVVGDGELLLCFQIKYYLHYSLTVNAESRLRANPRQSTRNRGLL